MRAQHRGALIGAAVEYQPVELYNYDISNDKSEGNTMNILVLGGAGYIGSHTVYELIDSGEKVVVVDNLLTGFRGAVHPDAVFYEGDIRDRAFMDSVFE